MKKRAWDRSSIYKIKIIKIFADYENKISLILQLIRY